MVLFVTIIILVLPFHYFVDNGHMFFVVFIQLLLILLYMLFQLSYVGFGFLQGLRMAQSAPAFAFVYAEIHSSTHRAVSAVRVPLPHPKSRQESVHTFHYKCQCRSLLKTLGRRPPSFQQAVRLRGSKLLSFRVTSPVRGFCSFFHMRYLLHFSWITQK